MTIVWQNRASLATTIQNSKSANQGYLWNLLRLGAIQLQRFWWHTKAYGTILGVMLLTLISLIYLGIYWSFGKLLSVLTHRVISSNGWDTSNKLPRF